MVLFAENFLEWTREMSLLWPFLDQQPMIAPIGDEAKTAFGATVTFCREILLATGPFRLGPPLCSRTKPRKFLAGTDPETREGSLDQIWKAWLHGDSA
jgi:hypothetical protein